MWLQSLHTVKLNPVRRVVSQKKKKKQKKKKEKGKEKKRNHMEAWKAGGTLERGFGELWVAVPWPMHGLTGSEFLSASRMFNKLQGRCTFVADRHPTTHRTSRVRSRLLSSTWQEF
jgi:hypothetical protein